MNNKKLSKQQIVEIVDLYFKQQKSLQYISRLYECSATCIGNTLTREGYKLRTKYALSRRYNLNEHYFDEINSDDKAYWFGFLLADGNIMSFSGNYIVRLCLQERDKYILELFNKCLESNRPLKYRDFHYDIQSKGQNSYTLNINSKHMVESLISKGLVPNKSLVLEFPSWISSEFFPAMLRGYIDGDGWIYKYSIEFMSSDKFCIGVQNFLKNNYDINSKLYNCNPNRYNEHTKILRISVRDNVLKLVNLMFSKENCICLDRKLEKYKKYYFNNSQIA